VLPPEREREREREREIEELLELLERSCWNPQVHRNEREKLLVAAGGSSWHPRA
jgi:hypothetical protein